jgi:hypothetical protein
MSGLRQEGIDPRDPGLFPLNIDLGVGRAGFVRTDRAALSAEPFLDYRWRAPETVDVTLPLSGLSERAESAAGRGPPRLNFIWHTSFCASTLLSACLDRPGRSLSLREPCVLVMLANLKRSGRLGPPEGLARTVFGLLARRFEPDEQILVKPSNAANNLIAEAAALTQGRMLLLHSDCESFVLAMASRGRLAFRSVREQFWYLAADGHPAARWSPPDLLGLTDLEFAALVWRMQMDELEAVSARLGDRARSLDCRLLLDDPGSVLPWIDDFLGLGLGREHIDQVVAGPLFTSHAKTPGRSFDAQGRDDERARLRERLGADLPDALRSIDQAFPRPPNLGRGPSTELGLSAPAA